MNLVTHDLPSIVTESLLLASPLRIRGRESQLSHAGVVLPSPTTRLPRSTSSSAIHSLHTSPQLLPSRHGSLSLSSPVLPPQTYFSGRSHLFGAPLLQDFLDRIELSEEVLGIGAQAVVLRGTLRRPLSPLDPLPIDASLLHKHEFPQDVAAADMQRPSSGRPTPTTGDAVAVKFIFRDQNLARLVRDAFAELEAATMPSLPGSPTVSQVHARSGGGGGAVPTSNSLPVPTKDLPARGGSPSRVSLLASSEGRTLGRPSSALALDADLVSSTPPRVMSANPLLGRSSSVGSTSGYPTASAVNGNGSGIGGIQISQPTPEHAGYGFAGGITRTSSASPIGSETALSAGADHHDDRDVPPEIAILSMLPHHQNLIQYLHHWRDDVFYYLVLELAGPQVAWSEAAADHAWNSEAPARGFGAVALSAVSTPRTPSLAIPPSLLSLSTPRSGTLVPLSPIASTASAAAEQEVAFMQSTMRDGWVASPSRELFFGPSLTSLDEMDGVGESGMLPPLPLWKTSRDLFECLDRFGPFCEDRARLVFRQLVDIVEFLHAHNVCHRDLKDENILVNDRLEVKLIDFGSAAEGFLSHGAFGTDAYNAPEAIKSSRKPCPRLQHPRPSPTASPLGPGSPPNGVTSPAYGSAAPSSAVACNLCYDGSKAELYALGVLLYVMLNVEAPYDDPDDALRMPPKPYQRRISEQAKLVISRLMQRDPNRRWSIADVRGAPWMKAGSVHKPALV